MARPRTFDETHAIEAAMDCFWQNGFEATSVRELAEEMGINGPSLYNAFGDKRGLFARALETYCERATRERLTRLETTHAPKRAIEAFFEEIIAKSVGDHARRGCFLVNSALDVAPHDRELGKRIAGYLGEISAFFARAIRAGQHDGSIAAHVVADDMANTLLSCVLGIRVLARSRPERALLESVVRPVLALLEARPSPPARAARKPRKRAIKQSR